MQQFEGHLKEKSSDEEVTKIVLKFWKWTFKQAIQRTLQQEFEFHLRAITEGSLRTLLCAAAVPILEPIATKIWKDPTAKVAVNMWRIAELQTQSFSVQDGALKKAWEVFDKYLCGLCATAHEKITEAGEEIVQYLQAEDTKTFKQISDKLKGFSKRFRAWKKQYAPTRYTQITTEVNHMKWC